MAEELKKQLALDTDLTVTDITEPIHNLITRKFEAETQLLKKWFEATEYYFDKLVRDIENYVDEEKVITH